VRNAWVCFICLAIVTVAPHANAALAGSSLEDALRQLEADGLTLVFSSQIVTPGMRVEREPTATDLVGKLEQLLAPQGLEARPLPRGGFAIVRAAPRSTATSLEVRVVSSPQAAPIAGALVRVGSVGPASRTDRRGIARFPDLEPGEYTVEVRTTCCGAREVGGVTVPAAARLDVTMNSAEAGLEELVVHASRYAFTREEAASRRVLPRDLFEAVPGVSEDAVRVLQRLPGTATNGLSARTHVRGANEDELLVRFDGIRLYNPFHLKDFQGLFGILDPETLEGVEYFSGGFPTRYGDRAGGVLDIEPRRSRAMQTLLGVSFLNSRLVSSGTAFDGRGEWLVGARRSNLNAVLKLSERDVGEPEFQDFILRYQQALSDATSVTVGILGLDDRLDLFSEDRLEEAHATYRDRYTWARIEHDFGDHLSARVTVEDATLTTSRGGDVLRVGTSNGELRDRRDMDIDTLGIDFTYTPRSWLQLTGGAEASDVAARYDYNRVIAFEGPLAAAYDRPALEERAYASSPDGSTYAAFLAAKLESGDWAAELGARWDRATYGSVGSSASPRLSVSRRVTERSTLRVTVGRYVQTQSINELEVEDPQPRFAAPEDAWHAIASYERQLPTGPELRVEAFMRRTDDPRARYESQLDPIVLLPDLEVDRIRVAPDRSSARGLELSLENRDATPISWWANYTWSRASDEFGQSTVPKSWDQRHAVSAGLRWTRGRWGVSATVNWHSGWPYTPLEVEPAPDGSGYQSIDIGPRNFRRFSDYFALDLRADYAHPLPVGSLEAFVEVLNATNRDNACCREVEVLPGEGASFGLDVDQKGWIGIVPIVGLSWRF
jgi:outer membrane cobalamin receptor